MIINAARSFFSLNVYTTRQVIIINTLKVKVLHLFFSRMNPRLRLDILDCRLPSKPRNGPDLPPHDGP
jgi:hypothetical protein